MVALAGRVGAIDILVNSSGLSHRAPWWEEQSVDWKRIMTLNVEAPFWLSQLFLPKMIENKWGRIINISSIYGVVAGDERRYPGLGVHMPSYFTSKHALIGLTKFLAAQVAKSGVTVNALCPGSFDSPANRQYFSPGPLLDAVSEATPMGRIGTDRELRTALLFLAAPGSSFITGQALVVDGGWTIWEVDDMTNIRLIGYTALAVGLINWRYIDFQAGSFALVLGVLVLLGSLIKPIHAKIEKGAGFTIIAVLAAMAIIYSFLA